MPLNRNDVRALRNADTVIFHHEHRPDHDARTFVICEKQHDPGDGFGPRELRQEIDLSPALFTKYELPGDGADPIVWATGVCRKYTPEWETARDLLREGDELVPIWILGNNSDNLRLAGMSHDEFKVEIRRRTRSGQVKRMTFWIDDSICASHSPARMATRSNRVFT